jgi:5-methylcytosine-specific restriction endonuclease McrA
MSWATHPTSQAWRDLRLSILRRDKWRCQIRGQRCTGKATHVDHILGRGVSERPEDLRAACATCNLERGDPRKLTPDPRPRTRW